MEQSFASDEGGLLSYLKDSLNTLNNLQRVYQPAKELAERMESAYIELKDISQEVSSQGESIEFNPTRLDEVNDRLNMIYSLQQKHRVQTLEELIALTEEYRGKLSDITSYDERIAELTERKEEQYKQGPPRRFRPEPLLFRLPPADKQQADQHPVHADSM